MFIYKALFNDFLHKLFTISYNPSSNFWLLDFYLHVCKLKLYVFIHNHDQEESINIINSNADIN